MLLAGVSVACYVMVVGWCVLCGVRCCVLFAVSCAGYVVCLLFVSVGSCPLCAICWLFVVCCLL